MPSGLQIKRNYQGAVVKLGGTILRSGEAEMTRSKHPMFAELAPWIGILFLATATFAINVGLMWEYTMDDSFITWRYAKNLAAGAGITWNPGEAPVEGYTSFLWILVTAGAQLLKLDPETFSKLSGILFTLLTIWVGVRFVELLMQGQSKAALYAAKITFCCLLLPLPSTALHAISGMETALYTFLLTLLLYMAGLLTSAYDQRTCLLFWTTGLLLGLCRPEGNLAVLAAAIVIWFQSASSAKRRIVWLAVLLYLVPGAVYFWWRLHHFGVLLPLPFYLKVGGSGFPGITVVARFARYILSSVGAVLLLQSPRLLRKRNLWPGLMVSAILLGFFCLVKHIMGIEYRFLYPLMPFIFVIVAVSAIELCLKLVSRTAGDPGSESYVTRHAIPVLLVGLLLLALLNGLIGSIKYARDAAQGLREAHVELGRLLSQLRSQGVEGSLAIADVGAAPFISGWRTIDTYGLNDKCIALAERDRVTCVFSKNPTVVVLVSFFPDSFRPRAQPEQGYYSEALRRGMRPQRIMRYAPDYYLWLLWNPNTEPELASLAEVHK